MDIVKSIRLHLPVFVNYGTKQILDAENNLVCTTEEVNLAPFIVDLINKGRSSGYEDLVAYPTVTNGNFATITPNVEPVP